MITYRQSGETLIPDLKLNETEEQPLGQVRADAQDVPANASDDAVEQPAAKRDIAGAPAGDRRGGTEPSGAADAGADEGRGRDGSVESQRPDAMGSA